MIRNLSRVIAIEGELSDESVLRIKDAIEYMPMLPAAAAGLYVQVGVAFERPVSLIAPGHLPSCVEGGVGARHSAAHSAEGVVQSRSSLQSRWSPMLSAAVEPC